MKNKGILRMILSLVISVLLVFTLLGTLGLFFASHVAKSPDFAEKQLSLNGSYENIYEALNKKYDEISVQTSVPADVYKECITKNWVFDAVSEQVRFTYRLLDDENAVKETDYSLFDEKITAYFEKYAAENHVSKDDVYNQRLASTIENAKAVTDSVIDVFHIEAVKKTSLWPAALKYRPLLEKALYAALAADLVLIVLLVILKNPVYWTGASLFASGALVTVPCAYVLASGMIMKFTIKEYTVFTLITGTMKSVVTTALTAGLIMLVAGLVITAVSVAFSRRKTA